MPTLYNKTLTTANTEYSQGLPSYTRMFEFQCRTESDIRFAFKTGYVSTSGSTGFMTLKAGDYYVSPPMSQAKGAASTVYLGTDTAGLVIEILTWE